MFALTREELDKLLAVAGESRLLYHTAFYHGLRVSEAVALTPENFVGNMLVLKRLKGSNRTTQPASAELITYAKTVAPGQRLFPIHRVTANRRLKVHAGLAGIPPHKASMHKLKHTTAMLGLAGGMKINEVQTRLGHKSGASTMEYLKVQDDDASRAFTAAVGGSF